MADLKFIPDSYLTPSRQAPEQELADMVVTNPQALRLLSYGARDPRLSDPPHDHAQNGGEVLVDVPVASLTLGPEAGVIGIQIRRTTSLGANPRILCTAGIPLRAGVTQLSGLLSLAYDAVATITLYVSLRPYAETNRDRDYGLRAMTQVVFTPGAAPGESVVEFTITDLSGVGDSRYDREVELVVWQSYLPPAVVTSGHRVLGVYLDVLAVSTRARDTERSELPRQAISYADIKTGAILGQDLGRKLRDTHNGVLRGMLGRAPGLTNDGRSDPSRPYREEHFCGHTHLGIDVPDGCGSFYSDGAVLRDTLFAISFCHTNATAGLVEDYSGAVLHGTGVFDATSFRVEARASIPAGLGAMDVRFCLKTTSLQQLTRLRVHADVRDFTGASICTGVSSGVHQQENALDSDSLWVCEVDPLDNNLFVPMRQRRLARAGLWTLMALRNPAPITGMRASNQQISEVVRLSLTQPKIRSTDTYHPTGDYTVILRWELQQPDLADVDRFTKVNWVFGLPSRGF